MLKIRDETSAEAERGDPLQVAEGFQDPEDLMHDIIVGMTQLNNPGILKNAPKPEETPGNTPSASADQSEAPDNDNTEVNETTKC